ncbi:MAG TPA: hypothetical protein VFW40_14645 [Capsulimonadaceae bacterium]|nr:hypothetical protein [Capsulimonadaceae bacterium]
MYRCTDAIDFSVDGSRMAVAGDNCLVMDFASKEVIWRPEMGRGPVSLSPDGARVAQFFGLFDISTGQEITTGEKEFIGFYQPSALFFTPNGKYVVGGSKGDGIRVWNGYTAQVIKEFDAFPFPYTISLSPDGSQLAYAGSDSVYILPLELK